ncbi:hypothetical protein E5163_01745 [Marinicauda algicola]|uniref:Uncharacterized protein n=1 Tax=Marinicauda algicola TaxID=2029849 RepID=A0A4S2H3E4_9PROT|nr:hypothetical protein [Marinicauda algicola]TGY89888.1 hypothetical protein E5163_01745 [Marinicauda algicola]
MILASLTRAVRTQNWFAVFIEFVIVIAGVVIGFQITAWNEARQDRVRERIYLEQLLIDLQSDAETGRRGVASTERVDAAAQRVLAVLEGDGRSDGTDDAALVASLPYAGYAYLPLANDATYREMISTGALSLVEDIELKRALATYYASAEAGRQWDELLREEQYAYRAAIRGLLTREQFAWARAQGGEAHGEPPGFNRAAFLAEARTRPEIVDSLRSMGAVQQRLRDDSTRLSERADRLAALIRAALGEPVRQQEASE